ADTSAAAADAYRRAADTCPELLAHPGFPLDYAETLALAGDADGARRVLADAGRTVHAAAEQAPRHLLAGRLPADAPGARAESQRSVPTAWRRPGAAARRSSRAGSRRSTGRAMRPASRPSTRPTRPRCRARRPRTVPRSRTRSAAWASIAPRCACSRRVRTGHASRPSR